MKYFKFLFVTLALLSCSLGTYASDYKLVKRVYTTNFGSTPKVKEMTGCTMELYDIVEKSGLYELRYGQWETKFPNFKNGEFRVYSSIQLSESQINKNNGRVFASYYDGSRGITTITKYDREYIGLSYYTRYDSITGFQGSDIVDAFENIKSVSFFKEHRLVFKDQLNRDDYVEFIALSCEF